MTHAEFLLREIADRLPGDNGVRIGTGLLVNIVAWGIEETAIRAGFCQMCGETRELPDGGPCPECCGPTHDPDTGGRA